MADKHEADSLKAVEPTMEQWAQLYDIAAKLNDLAPWKVLRDMDIITLELPDLEEQLFCSVMGMAKECVSIAVYLGTKGLSGFYSMVNMAKDTPPTMIIGEQECLVFYMGDREELDARDRKVIKELGLKFRGRGQWPYFRSMRMGYFPWFLEKDEAQIMIDALQNLYMACGYVMSGDLAVDFDAGETLVRFYSEDDGEWLNGTMELGSVETYTPSLILSDKGQLDLLKNRPKHKGILELDYCLMPIPIQENRNERPYFSAIAMLVDHEEGFILNEDIRQYDEMIGARMVSTLCDFIYLNYCPSDIYFRDRSKAALAKDVCKKLGIKQHVGKGMPATNKVYQSLLNGLEME